MGQPLLLPPELNESVTRIRTTDAGTLRRAAAALDATARTADSVSRQPGRRASRRGPSGAAPPPTPSRRTRPRSAAGSKRSTPRWR